MANLHFDPTPKFGAAVWIPLTTKVEMGRAYLMIFVLADAYGLFSDLGDESLTKMAEEATLLARVEAKLAAPDLDEDEDAGMIDALEGQRENLHDNCRCLPAYRTYRVWYDMAKKDQHAGAAIKLLTSDHIVNQFIRIEYTVADLVGATEVPPGELGTMVADFWKNP